MAEGREARRAAERTARERLAGPLISAVGELGVAVAGREAAAAAVATATERAREHVRRAQIEADQMVSMASEAVTAAEEEYRLAHAAAVEAGWSPAALEDMGYASPSQQRRARSRFNTRRAQTDSNRQAVDSAGEARVAVAR